MDIISNSLTKIRNAYLAGHQSVSLGKNNKNRLITEILIKKGILSADSEDETNFVFSPQLIELNLKRISKPGRRFYEPYANLKANLKDFGFKVISTSKGILTDDEAVKAKIGGEVLFKASLKYKK